MHARQPFDGPSFTVAAAVQAVAWSVEEVVLPRCDPTDGSRSAVAGADALWMVTATWHGDWGKAAREGAANGCTGGLPVQLVHFGAAPTVHGGVTRLTRFAHASASYARTPVAGMDAVARGVLPGRRTGLMHGRFIAAGASARFGDTSRLPEPQGVDRPAEGMTRLSIQALQARRVDLCGDWDGWRPVTATRADGDIWYVDVPLRPGVYQYAFRINDLEWRVPDDAVTVKDGFGWLSACVTVAGRAPSDRASSNQR